MRWWLMGHKVMHFTSHSGYINILWASPKEHLDFQTSGPWTQVKPGVLKVWSLGQQHQPYLETLKKCRFWGPTSPHPLAGLPDQRSYICWMKVFAPRKQDPAPKFTPNDSSPALLAYLYLLGKGLFYLESTKYILAECWPRQVVFLLGAPVSQLQNKKTVGGLVSFSSSLWFSLWRCPYPETGTGLLWFTLYQSDSADRKEKS